MLFNDALPVVPVAHCITLYFLFILMPISRRYHFEENQPLFRAKLVQSLSLWNNYFEAGERNDTDPWTILYQRTRYRKIT